MSLLAAQPIGHLGPWEAAVVGLYLAFLVVAFVVGILIRNGR